jgi:hypothetical protein
MLNLILLSTAALWHGPVTVNLGPAEVANPYDWTNRPEVVLTQSQTSLVQQAFYDDGQWKARVMLPKGGSWSARLRIKGESKGTPVSVNASTPAKGKGFIRIDKKTMDFKFDDGTLYWPVGFNLGWDGGGHSIEALMSKMGARGLNWGRVWACHWDNKNPFWPSTDPKPAIGRMDPKVLANWDRLVSAAERTGIYFQFVLFHHGPYSSRVNSNWGEHPWNEKNGGFLNEPGAFFTNPLAKNLAKSWLREAVARWGHSQAVMSWELFNEVEWVDNRYDGRINQVADWHVEMANYLKEIDPVGRLVTTSSEMELPIYSAVDYYQPHGYVPSVQGLVMNAHVPTDKPFFFGEVGPNGSSAEEHKLAARDGIWAGLMAGHPGAAQYWFWDRIEKDGILEDAGRSIAFIRQSGILGDRRAKTLKLGLKVPVGGDLKLIPGRGWAKTEVPGNLIRLPQDSGKAGSISSYFQGTAHRDMHPEALAFEFTQTSPGRVSLSTAQTATGGGSLELWVNGQKKDSVTTAPGQGERQAGKNLSAETPSGKVRVEVRSTGPDWIQVTGITFTGLAPTAEALSYGSPDRVLMRVRRTGDLPTMAGISGLPIRDGRVDIVTFDLDSGTRRTQQGVVRGGALTQNLRVENKDGIVFITPR